MVDEFAVVFNFELVLIILLFVLGLDFQDVLADRFGFVHKFSHILLPVGARIFGQEFVKL